MVSQNITFKSRAQVVRDAQWVAQKAHSHFPHVSMSLTACFWDNNPVKAYKFRGLERRNDVNIGRARAQYPFYGRDSFEAFTNIINRMKNSRVGNCFEGALLGELVAKMNGAKNVYTGSLFFDEIKLDHRVAFVTDKPVKMGDNVFKGKEAVIIDPWLGIADYAGNIFDKFKHDYNNIFRLMPDEKFYIWGLDRAKVTVDDFKAGRLEKKPKHKMKLVVSENVTKKLSEADLQTFRSLYPELLFQGKNGRNLFENV